MIPIPDRLARMLVAGIACLALLALLVQDRNRWKAKTSHYAELLSAERGAHAATVASFRAASESARQADQANAARVQAAQAAINERSVHDLESRLAAARAAADRLRGAAAAATDLGGSGATLMPGIPSAAGSAAQAACEDGLPAADALIATEQAIQLDELVKWVRQQGAIPANEASD